MIIRLLISLLCISALIPTALSEEPSASKTTAWLVSKLNGYGMTVFDSSGVLGQMSWRIDSFTISNGVISITQTYFNTGNHPVRERTSNSVRMADLYADVYVSKPLPATPEGACFVSVCTKDNSKCLQIPASDAEFAGRIAKALQHLLKLNGNASKPKEPF